MPHNHFIRISYLGCYRFVQRNRPFRPPAFTFSSNWPGRCSGLRTDIVFVSSVEVWPWPVFDALRTHAGIARSDRNCPHEI